MDSYKPRNGIVLTRLCDTLVLIPSRIAYRECRIIQKLPSQWGMLWIMLEHGESMDSICQYYEVKTMQPRERIVKAVSEIAAMLCEKGFLVNLSHENNRAE